jgi:hypothetical protein
MWHVTLTVRGEPVHPDEVRAGLERLQDEHPFLLAGRYSQDCAEVRYWEEAEHLEDAAALALRLWGEHRRTAGLPAWGVVGLEVIDRETFSLRGARGELDVRLAPAGAVRPFGEHG